MIHKIKIRLALLAVIVFILAVSAYPVKAEDTNYCIECHSMIHEEITDAFVDDIHGKVGLSCVDCHGGNAEIDDESGMDKRYGFVGAPKSKDIPKFCARCHSSPAFMHDYNPQLPTDQEEKYWTSVHGQQLRKGDPKPAQCTSCHMTHSIMPANDPRSSVYPENVPATCGKCHADETYMAEYGIPTTQYEQYIDTLNVHGYALLQENDISAPACNDCHGNHGATPPGIENVALVCTQCHALNGRFFRNSPHMDGFEAMEVSQCAFCHQKDPSIDEPHARIHTIVKASTATVGTGENDLCIQCHDADDPGGQTAAKISAMIDSLDHRYDHAVELLEKVEEQGLEVSDERWTLDSEVKQGRMELRTALHHFDLDEYKESYVKADTSLNSVLLAGSNAEQELGKRRNYYLLLSLLIAAFVVALIMKLKDIEQKD